MKVKEHTDWGYTQYDFHCPGCGHKHTYVVAGPGTGPRWQFNGDVNKPTFTPSLLNRWGRHADPTWQEPEDPEPSMGWSGTCHLYVTNGQIQYLGDCSHDLAGKTIEMEDIV